MRKLLLSLSCLAFMAGIVVAADYTVVSYDKEKKVLTVKDKDGKEVTGKLTDKTKVMMMKKDEKVEGKVETLEKMWSSDKAVGKKVELTIEKGEITDVLVGKKK